MSSLARFVVIIWRFVVLILAQSYPVSLTSLLTLKQLSPSVTDVYELKKNGLNVGYQGRSFDRGILKGLGFEDSQLKVYKEMDQMQLAIGLSQICGPLNSWWITWKSNG